VALERVFLTVGRTAIWLASELTGAKFTEVPEEDGTTVVIECEGIGFTPIKAVEEVNNGTGLIEGSKSMH
jgi:predicted methyltransferase